MPRRGAVVSRGVTPDPEYGDLVVTKFINFVMRKGKKSVAEGICRGAFALVKAKTQEDPLKIFKAAMENVKPVLEVRSRRVGGATYQVPVDVRPPRRVALAIRWIIRAAQARPGKSMAERLAGEIMDAANSTGAAVKRREETHRMAEANRAFAHYRW